MVPESTRFELGEMFDGDPWTASGGFSPGSVLLRQERGRITEKDNDVLLVGLCSMAKISYADRCDLQTSGGKKG